MTKCRSGWLGLLLLTMTASVPAADGGDSRQAEVARRGAQVMPFELQATAHIFSKMPDGGTQQVIARDSRDAVQTQLVRQHLKDIQQQFKRGDFSGPTQIHGAAMPGLAGLKVSSPGSISIAYREIRGGAALRYRTTDPKLVVALHKWFDAQLADHDTDAMQSHPHHTAAPLMTR